MKGGSAKDGFSGGAKGSVSGGAAAARGNKDAQDKLGAPGKTSTDSGQDAKAQRTQKSVAEYAAERTAQRNAQRQAVRNVMGVGSLTAPLTSIAKSAFNNQPLSSQQIADVFGLGIPGAVKATMDALGVKGVTEDPNASADKQGADDRPLQPESVTAAQAGDGAQKKAVSATFPGAVTVPEGSPGFTGYQKVQSLVPGQNIFTNPEVAARAAPFIRNAGGVESFVSGIAQTAPYLLTPEALELFAPYVNQTALKLRVPV